MSHQRVFVGLIIYADDIFFLALNRKAAQILLSFCEKFAQENNILFSTHVDPNRSKSKAMLMSGKNSALVTLPPPLKLCGKDLPWIFRCQHLDTLSRLMDLLTKTAERKEQHL